MWYFVAAVIVGAFELLAHGKHTKTGIRKAVYYREAECLTNDSLKSSAQKDEIFCMDSLGKIRPLSRTPRSPNQ